MIASITTCPECKTLLLEDTKICPQCHHVLQKGGEELAEVYKQSDDRYDGSDEVACPDCNAKNRPGLVRCWQCGGFLKKEIEKAFQEMQLRPSRVLAPEVDIAPLEETADDDLEDDLGDFELDAGIDMVDAGEAWFQEGPDQASGFDEEEPGDEETTAAVAEVEDEDDDEEENVDLLNLAVTEEKEHTRSTGKRKPSRKNSFLIQGPCGECKIRVQRYHQGEVGVCPKCTLPFLVPVIDKPKKKEKTEKKTTAEPLPAEQIIEGAKWNELKLKKFKPKANALKGKGEDVDIVFWNNELIVTWPKQKGLKGNARKQAETVRLNIANHLRANRPLQALPTDRYELLTRSQVPNMKVVQPASEGSFTAGEPVFGDGMIAIELPNPPEPPTPAAPPTPAFGKGKKGKKPKKPKAPPEPPTRVLALTLSQYRKLRKWAPEITEQPDFLTAEGVPLENTTETKPCVLSEKEFDFLVAPEYYQADPALPVVEVGWSCQACEAVVSEEARAEQKLGGKKPAGLAKAKCPKCEEKFGKNPLFHLKSIVDPEPEQPEKSEAEGERAEKAKAEKRKGSFSLGSLFSKRSKDEASDAAASSTATEAGGQTSSVESDAEEQPASAPDAQEDSATATAEQDEKKSLFGGLFSRKEKAPKAKKQKAGKKKKATKNKGSAE